MSEDKRTKIGSTGPQRVQRETGGQPVAAAGTPVPATAGGQPVTSYIPQTTDPLIGQTLAGRYAIQKKLGEGGMGAVYLATHTLLDKSVALKVLHGEFARKPDLVERFMQEAKSASRIRHENVIDISDFGTTPEGLVFFAMELLKGHDLHEEIARARLAGQLLPWARSKKIFLQICSALSAAHAQGIIHRDLKPENVYLVDFLGEPDFVKLLDFGIAKLTEVDEGGRKLTKTGMLFGTPEYMSPEQARGENVDSRVDVYAMGCILFQLVTGRVPFEAENFMGVLSLHLTEQPPSIPVDVFDRIGAPRELAGVIDRALQKNRDQRWSSIDELAHAVRRVSGDPVAKDGHSAALPKERHASVPAPANTTQSRQRTQWTGNLAVPGEEEPAKPSGGRSKLPLILGALIVLGGGAVALSFALEGGGDGTTTPVAGSNVASGSAVTLPATVPDAGVVEPPLPPLPDQVTIKIDSKPRGAMVYDLNKKRELRKTPLTVLVPGSRTELSFSLSLKGYNDVIVDLTPDHDITYVAPLEKGVAGAPAKRQVVPAAGAGSATVAKPETKPDTAVTRPDTGSAAKPDAGSAAKPDVKPDAKPDVRPDVKPDAKPDVKPPEDDCPGDLPCVKNPFKGSAAPAPAE